MPESKLTNPNLTGQSTGPTASQSARKQRTLKYGVNSGLAALIFGGILVAANVIGARLFARADLTEGKEFTISSSTKQILKRLDDVVQIKVFFSKKLPPQLATLEQQVGDLLKEYEVYSDGKVTVRFFDPESEDVKGQARSMGIPEVQMNVLEKDQYRVVNVLMGLGVQYGDKTEPIPLIQDVTSLEYELSSALVKVTRTEEKTVGFLTGHGERTLDRDLEGMKRALEQQFAVRTVDLSQGRVAVPEDIALLIVAGPSGVTERTEYQIDQYIMRGGKVIFLLDPMKLNEQVGLSAIPVRSGLDDLVAFYGARPEAAIVLDPARNSQATFQSGFFAYSVAYPLWPRITTQLSGFNPEQPITSRLESLTLPWTAPLEVNVAIDAPAKIDGASYVPPAATNADQPDVRATILCQSTEQALTQQGRYELNPQTLMATPPTGAPRVMPLAVLLRGTFKSFYAGKPVPSAGDEAMGPDGVALDGTGLAAAAGSNENAVAQSPDTQVLVVGSSHFATNQFLRSFPENALFLQNSIDYLTLGDELIAIRSRGATERPLQQLSDGAKAAVRYGNTFGTAALVVAFGLIQRGLRRKSREALAATYREEPAR